jgi:gluconate kinase
VLARAEGTALRVELCRIGRRRFAEPHFTDSVEACLRQPFHNAFRQDLDIDTLARWVDLHPGLGIGGFVFHMSRSGATRLGQWLAAVPAHRVMAEAPPLDAALRAGTAVDENTRLRWVRTLVGLLGQTMRDEERRLFVTFDSWHAHQLPLLRRAFPQVPWLFLMRDPVEVLVSHLRRPGAQMVPGLLGPGVPGLAVAEAARLPREVYAARVLGGICEAVEQAFASSPQGGQVIDHATLPEALDEVVAAHFGLQPDADADARRALADAAGRCGWSPHGLHVAGGMSTQSDATDGVREAAARWVEPPYRRLLARCSAAQVPME